MINEELIEREFTAKEIQAVLKLVIGNSEKIGLALLNYYARTDLVPSTGKEMSRGRNKYTYSDLLLLCWLFRLKQEGLPVVRYRKGLEYLRRKLPKLYKNPQDMILLTNGKELFIKHREDDKLEIAEALTGKKAGQYVWAYAIGSLIEEVRKIVEDFTNETRKNPSLRRNSRIVLEDLSLEELRQKEHRLREVA